MEPRPVVGLREYRLDLRIPGVGPADLRDAWDVPLRRTYTVTERSTDLLRVQWSTRSGEDGPIQWRAEIALRPDGADTIVAIRARRDPYDPLDLVPPEAVRKALWEPVRERGPLVGTTLVDPVVLAPPWQDMEEYTREVLLSPSREISVVVLTTGRHGTAEMAERLAEELLGFVNVVRLSDEPCEYRLHKITGKPLGAYQGAARIYRPGLTPASDPLDHDLLVARYLDMRLLGGKPLSYEIARRVLPPAGGPIPPIVTHAKAPTPPEDPQVVRIRELENERTRLVDAKAALQVEVDRLRAENQSLSKRLTSFEGRVPPFRDPRLPWTLSNPEQREIELDPVFVDQVRVAARDESLAAVARKKMEAVLLDPEGYGKDMRGARHGQRATYVARNYRLVWSTEGGKVRFVLLVSKEDPEYSPHGA